jgi:hypothetical protein
VCLTDGSYTNVYLYAGGRVSNLGYLPGHPPVGAFLPPYVASYTAYVATSLNDFDTVIGGVFSNIGFSTFWIFKNGQMYDLVKSIEPQTGFIISVTENIVDDGRILAVGEFSSPDGSVHTVMLTPLPNKSLRP